MHTTCAQNSNIHFTMYTVSMKIIFNASAFLNVLNNKLKS